MRNLSQVQAALESKYDGPIEKIRGYSYIPWAETVQQANNVFGPLGWSNEVMKLLEDEGGYLCVQRVTALAYDESRECVVQLVRDGVGYGELQKTRDGRQLRDTAVKTAASDALSRAFKLVGDAFGLYLYEKANKEADADETPAPAKKPAYSGGEGKKHWTQEEYGSKVLGALRRNKVSDATIKLMSWQQARDAMKLFIEDHMDTQEVLEALGLGGGDAFSKLY